jgi:hypothetical protein
MQQEQKQEQQLWTTSITQQPINHTHTHKRNLDAFRAQNENKINKTKSNNSKNNNKKKQKNTLTAMKANEGSLQHTILP